MWKYVIEGRSVPKITHGYLASNVASLPNYMY